MDDVQGGNGDSLGFEVVEGRLKAGEVVGVGQQGNVDVAAKLGCAVQDARLSSHEEVPDLPSMDRRKGPGGIGLGIKRSS